MSNVKIKVGDVWIGKVSGDQVIVTGVTNDRVTYSALDRSFSNNEVWKSLFLFVYKSTSEKALNPSCIDLDDYLKSMPESGRARISKKAEALRPELVIVDDQVEAKPKAPQILQDAIDTMIERGKSYDKDGDAERSMDKVVAMFEILTGIKMTAAQGYKFMVLLKQARSEQGADKLDNYIDGAAYMALAGEAAKDT